MTATAGPAKSIAILLVGAGFVFTGNGLFQTLLPLRADLEGFATALVGLMGTGYFAGFVLGCLIGPALVKAVGHIRAFAGVTAMAAALTLLFPMLLDPYAWIGLRLLTGICLATVFMVVESWLNDQASDDRRGRVLSAYIIVSNLVTMAGQFMVNLAPLGDQNLFTLVAILVCLSAVAIALLPQAEPTPIPSARVDLKGLLAISPSGTVGCLLVGAVEGAFWTLGPVFGQQRGMEVFEVTLLMAAFVLGGTISQWPLGRLSDRMDRRRVILPTALATVATGLVIALVPLADLRAVLAMATLHGALMVPLYALMLSHANDSVPNERLVQVSSGLLLIYSIGAALGPVAAAPVMAVAGAGGLFLFISAALAALAAFILYRMLFGRRTFERIEVSPFMPVPKTSQSVYELEVDSDDDDGKGAA